MKKLFLLALAVLLAFQGAAQERPDSTVIARLEEKMDEYFRAIEREDAATKSEECDFLIEACPDSLLRQHIALYAYDHYVGSKVMGDEAVAIHLTDKWFIPGLVKMADEIDLLNAKVFADFNRHTLIGEQAPALEMENVDGEMVALPAQGHISLLYFYDVNCSKCKMESILLKHFLEEGGHSLDFYAVYAGSDREAWEKYIAEKLDIRVEGVTVHHLWDPEMDTDFGRLYGVVQTPRMFLTGPDGVIIGRGLDTQALKQLIGYAEIQQELYDRCAPGSRLPSLELPGMLCSRRSQKAGIHRLDKLRGRPAYLIFHTDGCENCRKMLEAIDSSLASNRRSRALLVNVDKLVADYPGMAQEVFDSFDLTVLPHVIVLDKKGIIVRKGLE